MSERTLSKLLALVFLSLALPSGAPADVENRHGHRVAIDIVTPIEGSTIDELPVAVTVRLSGRPDLKSFRARLNGNDVTSRFSLTKSETTAALTVKDGINVSDAGQRLRNRLKVSVRARRANDHHYRNRRHVRDDVRFWVLPKPLSEAMAVIPPEGGDVSLPGVGKISFPAGTFEIATTVRLGVSTDPEMAERFESDAAIFRAQGRLPYELRISAPRQPRSPARLTFDVPSSFLAGVPATAEIRAFVFNFWRDAQETLESFELLPERFPPVTGAVTVDLPPYAFTDGLRTDGMFEATALLAATPTAPRVRAAVLARPNASSGEPRTANRDRATALQRVTRQQAGGCQGATIASPLDGELNVRSPFGPRTHPVTGVQQSFHSGVDLRAANGTPVRAVANGTVEVRNNSTTGGHQLIVRHDDGSATAYRHLEQGSGAAPGTRVAPGDQIGQADTTGAVTGPHLHFEYAPNGQIFQSDQRVDPMECIGSTTGSITVADNGSAADDAFSVAINGLVVCTTTIGAANTCGVGALRPGTATLTITAVTAPDNLGTFQITLGAGLTFATGGTSVSGTVPQGGSASYEITIPIPPPLRRGASE